jgi:CBS domain containing-hemolysin-like protein
VTDAWLLVTAVLLVILAGAFSAADAAIAPFSRARAEELVQSRRAGGRALLHLLDDPRPYLNTALLLRLGCETSATVIVVLELYQAYGDRAWPTALTSIAIMLVVSFVVIGVSPRTVGRQHNERIALVTAAPLTWITRVLGPIPSLLILLGNAVTPGRGFREGPFSTETELREMVDLAEASNLIEGDERSMIHSVLELGETTAREVMVPRMDVVFVERHKNLRQTLSLFLRSGFSRLPVVDDTLDNTVGVVYLKDVVRRDFDAPSVETTERVESLMRPVFWVPESKRVDELLEEMQAKRQHMAVVVDEYGGTAGLITIEDILEEIVGEITDEYDTEDREPVEVDERTWRVPARYLVDDLGELTGVDVEDEDVDSVGGLMAKELGVVPIAGSTVEVRGLRLVAEETAGRRNKIGTVLITRLDPHDDPATEAPDE